MEKGRSQATEISKYFAEWAHSAEKAGRRNVHSSEPGCIGTGGHTKKNRGAKDLRKQGGKETRNLGTRRSGKQGKGDVWAERPHEAESQGTWNATSPSSHQPDRPKAGRNRKKKGPRNLGNGAARGKPYQTSADVRSVGLNRLGCQTARPANLRGSRPSVDVRLVWLDRLCRPTAPRPFLRKSATS